LGYEKIVPLNEFFTGPGKTVLSVREMVTRVQFSPMGPDEKYSWMKLGRRSAFTMPVISVATRIRTIKGRFDKVRIALGVAGPTPLRAKSAEDYLLGKEATPRFIEEAAEIVSREVQPKSSFRASAEYRRDMAGILTRKALASSLS
jgi:carbon-monoxide dehydrogenase medium subunit